MAKTCHERCVLSSEPQFAASTATPAANAGSGCKAHLLHGDTHQLRRDIFARTVFHPPPEPLPFKNSELESFWEDIQR